jgi:uncharacterized SAM-binding protein YcdF (DUF218 family)
MRSLLFLPVMLALVWAAGFALYFFQIEPTPKDSGEPCEALVVLTGSAGRIETGFKLLEQGRAPRLFITGVGDDRHSEKFLQHYVPSAAMRAKLESPEVLSIDRKATSTFENAEQTNIWLEQTGLTRLCLVTAHYHMPRSLMVFKTAMPKKTWIPIATEGWDVKPAEAFERPVIFRILAREYHKWLVVLALSVVS